MPGCSRSGGGGKGGGREGKGGEQTEEGVQNIIIIIWEDQFPMFLPGNATQENCISDETIE